MGYEEYGKIIFEKYENGNKVIKFSNGAKVAVSADGTTLYGITQDYVSKYVDSGEIRIETIVYSDKKKIELRAYSIGPDIFSSLKNINNISELDHELKNYFGKNLPVIIRTHASNKYNELMSIAQTIFLSIARHRRYKQEAKKNPREILVRNYINGSFTTHYNDKTFIKNGTILVVEDINGKTIVHEPGVEYDGRFDEYNPKAIYFTRAKKAFALGKNGDETIYIGDPEARIVISKTGVFLKNTDDETLLTVFRLAKPMQFLFDEKNYDSITYFAGDLKLQVSLYQTDIYKNASIARKINNNMDIINEFATI